MSVKGQIVKTIIRKCSGDKFERLNSDQNNKSNRTDKPSVPKPTVPKTRTSRDSKDSKSIPSHHMRDSYKQLR